MQAIQRIHARRLIPAVALAGLLAGGAVWLGFRYGPAPASVLAEQKGSKAATPAAQTKKAIPVVAVVTRMPGMSPQAMESDVTNRLEDALRHAEGLRKIESKTTTGLSVVQLHFDESVAAPVAQAQAAGLAGTVMPHLPPGTPAPEVVVVDHARPLPACLLVLDADLSLELHADLARRHILPEFPISAGVTARLGPAAERVLAVMLDPARLQAYNVSAQAVRAALEEATAPPPPAMIRVGDRQFLLQRPLVGLDDLKNLPVRKAGPAIYLRDLARIVDFNDPPQALAHVNGRRRVWIAIHARRGVNDAAAQDAARKVLAKVQGRLPEGATLEMLTFGNKESTDAGLVTVHVSAAAGTRLEACDKIITQVEQLLKTIVPAADLRFMLAHVGPDPSASPAWPLRAGPHQATIRLQLTRPAGTRELVQKLRPLLRERFPDLRASVHAGAGTSWPVVVHVGGGTPLQCEKTARQAADRIAKLRGAADVEAGDQRIPALQIDVDLAKAAELGISPADVQRAVAAVDAGLICRVRVAGTDSDMLVTLRQPEAALPSLEDLSNIPILSPKAGPAVLLRDLATIKTTAAPAEIEHQDLNRVVTIRVNTDDLDSGALATAIENSLKELPMPRGMWLKVQQ